MKYISEADALKAFIAWGEQQDSVRAMLMTSSRTTPLGQIDALSDYDLILIANDVHPFYDSRAWLEGFGCVLALYRDPLTRDGDFETVGYVVQFEEGLKIDFTVWPIGLIQRTAAAPQLPDELDAGYRILLDKDHLTDGLKAPTYKAYIPTPPSEAAYQEKIELFFLDTVYVAKFLWRDDLVAAKHLLDHFLKQDYLVPMLEWRGEIDHNWTVKPGPFGRRLKQWIRPDLWQALAETYTGPDLDANWDALFKSIALMRRVSIEVGEHFGYAYPHEMEEKTMRYIHEIRNMN